ncbi:MAG: malto-oligosyltrehalose synthase [Microthrixaceae bacterium]
MTVARVATYRLQLTPGFGFRAAAELVGDLAELGVSHLYLSPVAEAVRGSTHGYDVVRPWEVRSELGGPEELMELGRRVRDAQMGLVLDLVPNHVATTEPERNPWWWALLEGGPESPVSEYFDVDWAHGGGRLLVPTLGRPPEEAMRHGELRVEAERIRYHDKSFPLTNRPPTEGRGAAADEGAELQQVLDAQPYELTYWRDPRRNFRRFFTIDELAAVRPEVDEVATAIASNAAALAREGLLEGVRVDHVDGLAEPGAYLGDLRARLGAEVWLLVEKILVHGELLPRSWPADGTTGYEWIRVVDHLFTDPAGEAVFTDLAAGPATEESYHHSERRAIREVLRGELAPDLDRAARTAASELHRRGAEAVRPSELLEPLVELTAQLGRYRTYLPTDLAARDGSPSPDEVAVLEAAAARAMAHLDAAGARIARELTATMLEGTELTRRWQQLSGPALAKGGEDRALYRWMRLGAHNEVGGDPGTWSITLDDFHRHNAEVQRVMPQTLLAGTTHDTKRSEDTRARLLALAGMPELWSTTRAGWVSELRDLGAPLDTVGGLGATLALQTLVAAWPIDADRLGDYLVKAAREADLSTSWTDPAHQHEDALRRLAGVLVSPPLAAGVEDLLGELGPAARSISSAQLALRLTAPGVPDLYQGSERWLHTLVDPDNRGPLHPGALRDAVRASRTGDPWQGPASKTALIRRVLAARSAAPACFGAEGGYEPMAATGRHLDHVVAFARTGRPGSSEAVVTVASRFPSARDDWHDTALQLPAGAWRDVLRDGPTHHGRVALRTLLGERSAAVLVRDRS